MPKIDKEKLMALEINRKVTIDPSSINKDERRVAITISTEEPIRRYDSWSGQYYEEVLLHGDENIDLSRAATAKLRYMHGEGKYGELPIGKLENVKIMDRKLVADAIFSTANPDADMLWKMVEEGTLTEISVGGLKIDMRITERENQITLVEVMLWEFREASLVDIGADKNAGIGRNLNQNEGEFMNKLEELKRQLEEVKGKQDEAAIVRAQADYDAELKRVQDENLELKRQASINDLAMKHSDLISADDLKRFVDDKNQTPDDVARFLLGKKEKAQTNLDFQRGQDSGKNDIQRAIADSLVIRAGFMVTNPHQNANQYMGASLGDIARAVTGYDGFNKDELVKRAMSTDDFPVLLGNVANRVLSLAYGEASSTYELWTTAVDVPDFREVTEVSRNKLGGRLRKITEAGEKKSKETGESAEKWRIYSYGEELTLTREMIINDDMGAFVTVIQDFGDMAKRTANGLVYDLLQGKGDFAAYKMSDTKAVFATEHKNTGTGADLTTTALSTGRKTMRRQTGAKGEALNITPKFLLVPPERETVALQLINSEGDLNGAHAGVSNPFKNAIAPIVEAELDAAPWYLVSERRTVKVGYLQGTNRSPIVREKERSLSKVVFECVFDFGVVVEDFRGLYKNTGV